MNNILPYILTIFFLRLIFSPAYAKEYIISPHNLGIDADWAQFTVKIRTNEKCYKAGERLIATITSNRDCYILVYYTNESGNCLIVYPNKYDAKNFVHAGEEFVIGADPAVFSLIVDKNQVRDYLQVIATDEPIDTTSLVGITDPDAFVKKIRLILKDRVQQKAKQMVSFKDVPINKRVFAIGTTDYLCNYDTYFPPGEKPNPPAPSIESGNAPVIAIRTVDDVQNKGGMVGPDANRLNTTSFSNGIYTVPSNEGVVFGTVSYVKGIKRILVNDKEPTIMRIGSSKGIRIAEASEDLSQILDFQYRLSDLTDKPKSITITAEGMDGKVSKKVIKVRGKR